MAAGIPSPIIHQTDHLHADPNLYRPVQLFPTNSCGAAADPNTQEPAQLPQAPAELLVLHTNSRSDSTSCVFPHQLHSSRAGVPTSPAAEPAAVPSRAGACAASSSTSSSSCSASNQHQSAASAAVLPAAQEPVQIPPAAEPQLSQAAQEPALLPQAPAAAAAVLQPTSTISRAAVLPAVQEPVQSPHQLRSRN